ncbi:Regulator of chromosome condensation (RCC1) repeat family protein [Theileria parva strain Muguga]|uniref:Regulator of chromosome condensation (RCC1) repeat family protein n=1 Tax=Theileria parva strain Muguga TaxID=333668 RepID=UPI001C620195|nr:Regulator of chromosome condensation (RCC1) repeat family protein [Theileria parva strain Muguga]EAN32688.2 Regulator of chromosome condensation (RCC1) repeat family protein [Theileria parva strain Muguga]
MDCKLSSKILPTRLFQTSSFSDVTLEKSLTKPQISYSNTRNVLSGNLEDLLYVDELSDEEAVVCLLRRFLRQKYFTYFGKVLFFLLPDRSVIPGGVHSADVLSNPAQFLYSESHECHLFSFLKQLFTNFMTPGGGVSVFFYGQNGQFSMNKSLLFLLQMAQTRGVRGAGELFGRICDVLKLLESWSDYTNDLGNSSQMTIYKINFTENGLNSVNFIPNFASDFSTVVLSGGFPGNLRFPGNWRFPSIFYGLLYSMLKGKNLHWITQTLTTQHVKQLLNSIPKHQTQDPFRHIHSFSQVMEMLMRIGLTVDETREINKVLISIVLFHQMAKTDTANSLTEWIELLCDVLEIGLMKELNVNLKSNDIVFKAELKKNLSPQLFSTVPSALYLRIKHLLYTKINQFLILTGGPGTVNPITRSILMCNSTVEHAGSEDNFSSRVSEELFLNLFYQLVEKTLDSSIPSEIAQKNKLIVQNLTGPTGILTQLTAHAIKLYNQQDTEHNINSSTLHSLGLHHEIDDIINLESKLHTINPILRKLLKYSKNQVLNFVLFTNNSLHHIITQPALALSFHSQLQSNEAVDWYFICCDTVKDLEFDESVDKLLNFYTNHIPILDICNMQRSGNMASYELEQYCSYYFSLLYTLTNANFHANLKLLNAEQSVRLLFKLLSVGDAMYKIEGNILTIKRTLQVKMLSLLNDYVKKNLKVAVTLQNWYKSRRNTGIKRGLVNKITRLQSLIRMNLIKKNIKLQNQAKIITNQLISTCVLRCYVYKWLCDCDSKTLDLLRPEEKRFHELEFEYLQNAAAKYIQAVWRGAIIRKKYSTFRKQRFEDFALTLVQSFIRRILSCYELLNVRNVKYTSCVMIQSYFRGYLTRKRYHKLQSLKLILLPVLLKGTRICGMNEQVNFIKLYKDHNSMSLQMKRLISVQTNLPFGFLKVQNLVRMHFIRKQFITLKRTLELVYSVAMTKCARIEYLEKVKSAVKIQRWWRLIPKDSIPRLSTGSLYYLNLREKNTVRLLSSELAELGTVIYSCNVTADVRRVYLNTWAMVPLTLIKALRLMQKSATDLNYTQMRPIESIQFAIGASHSLILIQTQNGSCVYSWGWNDKGQLGRKSLYPLKSSDNDFLITNPLQFHNSSATFNTMETFNTVGNSVETLNTMGNTVENTMENSVEPVKAVGNGELEDYPLYSVMEENVLIVSIVCGDDYSLALSDVGVLYSWGDNSVGQCGLGPRYLKIYQPAKLDLVGVTSICAASYHSVVVANEEFYTFGKAFGRDIFRPVPLRKLVNLHNQTIKNAICAGNLTLFYTKQMDYVLHIHNNQVSNSKNKHISSTSNTTNSNTVNPVNGVMYSYPGSIVCLSTNGRIICGMIEVKDELKVYLMGYVRCIPMEKSVGTKTLFVGAFRDKFEKKTKPKSVLNVHTGAGMSCYLPAPAEILLPRVPNQILCDGEQVIFITNSAVYGARLFSLVVDSPEDYDVRDNSTVEIRPGANVKLDPALYQFTHPHNKKMKLHTAFNTLSHSILYATK